MTAIVKITAVLGEKGALSAAQIGEHVESRNIHALLEYYTGKGTLVKTGAGREAVYDVSQDAQAAPPQRQKKKPRKSAAGRKTTRKTKPARKTKRKPKTSRRKRAQAPTDRATDGEGSFLAALTSDHCIALIRDGRVDVLSHEHSVALADLVLKHFEP